MFRYVFTPQGFEELKEAIKKASEDIKQLGQTKGTAANDQDGWHGESYKLAVQQEFVASKRMAGLEDIYFNSKVVKPQEQNQKIQIGNGVLLRFLKSKKEIKYILDGMRMKRVANHISIGSPLAKGLIGARVGEIKTIEIPAGKITVEIVKIVPPSLTKEFLVED